ncbi:WYL domain-containing protein [Algivirga pacifica]|uniref:WYL domain-containing protein n=1 Tax=Algivirga pacifica TaxID=1162670 RepID=A0ABP9D5Y6_9BACT
MPANKNAQLRLKVINECLQSVRLEARSMYEPTVTYSIEDLINACVEKIKGIKSVSLRTIKGDIQIMRDEYKAPIFYDKAHNSYYYDDPNYSIYKQQLTAEDHNQLHHLLHQLRNVEGFPQVKELDELIQKLEKGPYAPKGKSSGPVIEFENVNYKGASQLPELHEATLNKWVLTLWYQPFNKELEVIKVHPYRIKEYNKRYYLIGHNEEKNSIHQYPLDRIEDFEIHKTEPFISNRTFKPSIYRNIVGVTIPEEGRLQTIELWVHHKSLPYMETRPLHHSQTVKKRLPDGSGIVQLKVIPNFELDTHILRLGELVEVIKPYGYREHIKERVKGMVERYGE